MSDQLPCDKCGHYAVACDDEADAYREEIADLERRLAEAQAEIESFKATPEGGWFTAWNACDKDRWEAQAEIEAMKRKPK